MALFRTLALTTIAAGVSLPLSGAAPAFALPAEPNYAAITSDRAPALITIKFVIVLSGGGQSQERDVEAGGFFIDSKTGLILASNYEMGGGVGSHKDIKVLIGDDTEGVPAKIVGHDSEMELMWLRIEKPDKAYAAIDPAKGAEPKLGDHLVGLDRMSKYYDRVPVAFETIVGGIAKKPRPLIIPSGGSVANVGLPIFTAGGDFVGVSVVQRISMEDGGDPGSMGRQTSFDRGLKILPGSEIVIATARALEAETGKPEGEGEAEKKDGEPVGGGEKKEDQPPAPMPKSDTPKK